MFAWGLFSLYNLIMTFIFDALRDQPVGIYAMDDTSPLQDYSPYNGTATISGTPVQQSALVKGTAWSPVFNNSIVATYACPVFLKGFESLPFSLETWARGSYNSPTTSVVLTNLITNPSFKTATTGWTQYGQATATRNAGTGVDGAGYLTIVATSVVADTGASFFTLPNVIGTVYSAQWQVRNSGGSALNVRSRWNGGTSNYTVPNDGAWHTYTVTYTAGVTSNFFRPVEFYTTGSLNGTLDLDTVIITASSVPQAYFDGDTPGGAWTGTANASTSTMQPTFQDQKVLSHSDQYDGIVINGTVVKFITKYTSAPSAICSYDLQVPRNVHVVGVHTREKNSLYVNGKLVAEVALTSAQQADTYATNSANLVSGTSTGSTNVGLNGVAFYAYALGAEGIKRHYDVGSSVPQPQDVVLTNFGDYIPLDLSNNNLFLDQWIDTADEWNQGLHDNTDVVGDQLVPTQDASLTSVASRWYYSIDLAAASNSATVYGVQLDWDGNGAVVAVSLDGTTWENVTRGVNCATVPAGTTTSGSVLQIRITFAGGTVNDTSYVNALNIVGIKQAASMVASGRTITPTGSFPQRNHDLIEYNENYGIMIPPAATVLISADALGATVTRSIELLIRRQGVNTPTLSLTGTNYINGAAGSTLPDGQWVLWHVVLAADSAAALTITGPAQVAYVGVYDYALTAGQVAGIYADYVGTDAPRFTDASVISVSESATAANIYQHDWAILSSG